MANTKVYGEQIVDGSITAAKIADGTVLAQDIADDAITTAKIADDVGLGGSPTTTTQSASDNTTKVATTAYVTTALANLADSAPTTLDTLNELAAALGDDANFSTTVTNSIATKLPLAGGAMTGAITTNSTFDGVDIATRDAILTSTTTTAGAALPKAGGTLTGTVTSSSHLQIAGNLDIVGQIGAYNNPSSSWGSMNFRATDYVFKNSGGTSKMTLSSTGNLDLAGTLDVTGATVLDSTLAVAGATTILTNLSSDTTSTPDTVLTLSTKYASTGSNGVAGAGSRLEFKIPDDETNPITGAAIAGIKEAADDSDASAGMAFYISQNDTTLDEAVRIDHDGNVGIGTTSPSALLHAHGTTEEVIRIDSGDTGTIHFFEGGTRRGIIGYSNGTSIASSADAGDMVLRTESGKKLHLAISGTSKLVVDSSGNVGIGRTSVAQPSAGATTLAIQGTATTKGGAIRLYSSDDSVAAYIYPDSSSGLSINTSTSHPIIFRTVGAEAMRIASTGEVTKAKQPAFQAHPASQQNNIAVASDVTVVLGTEVFDVGANFASNTFTAPVTGKYQLNLFIRIETTDTAADYYQTRIVTSNRTYIMTLDPGALSSDPNYWTQSMSVLADMDASDAAYVTIVQNSGTVQTDIQLETTFSGYLAC
jgi:hypothetical protein